MTGFYLIMFVVPVCIVLLAFYLSNRIKISDNG